MKTEWIQKVESLIKESYDIPMWGQIPSFPWDKVAPLIKEVLQLPSFSYLHQKAEWVDSHHLLSGFGEHPFILSFVLSPLNPPFFLAISEEALKKITECLLRHENQIKSFDNPDYQKGFFRYLIIKLLEKFNELKIYEGLALKMVEAHLPKENCYSIDIQITISESIDIPIRLLLPSNFHKVLSSHFIKKPIELTQIKQNLELPISINAGQVNLKHKDLGQIKPGDFIILDSCSYHVNERSGSLTMSLFSSPLFIVKPKENQLKLLDFALFEEDTLMMDEEFEDEHLENEDLEEEEFEDAQLENEKFSDSAGIEPLIRSKDIPLTIHVEVAHLKMPLKKLLSLQPGNTLELKVRPEAGVNLTVNGKVIGRGELLQIGDLLGVKVTEITQ